MGRRPNTDDKALAQTSKRIRQAKDMDELRAAQAVLLPLLGLTLDQTGLAIGKDRYWVSRARNRSLRGEPPPTTHGGRRRSIVPEREELDLLREAVFHKGFNAQLLTKTLLERIRHLLEAQTDEAVADSTVFAFLERNAPKLVPEVTGVTRKVWRQLERLWHAQFVLNNAIRASRTMA